MECLVNKEYADLVYRQNVISKKSRSIEEEKEMYRNGKRLTEFELNMTSAEIITSIREAFKHVPEGV